MCKRDHAVLEATKHIWLSQHHGAKEGQSSLWTEISWKFTLPGKISPVYIMGVLVKTLQRRAKEWNTFTFTSITDAELDTVLRDCLHQFPQAGEAMLRGHIQSLNVPCTTGKAEDVGATVVYFRKLTSSCNQSTHLLCT